MPRTVIGCDLSSAVLDLHSLPKATSSQVVNDPEEIAVWVASLDPDVLVVFEATSGCDGPLIAALRGRNRTMSDNSPKASFSRWLGKASHAGGFSVRRRRRGCFLREQTNVLRLKRRLGEMLIIIAALNGSI